MLHATGRQYTHHFEGHELKILHWYFSHFGIVVLYALGRSKRKHNVKPATSTISPASSLGHPHNSPKCRQTKTCLATAQTTSPLVVEQTPSFQLHPRSRKPKCGIPVGYLSQRRMALAHEICLGTTWLSLKRGEDRESVWRYAKMQGREHGR